MRRLWSSPLPRAVAGARALAWRTLIATMILVILWIPIRRYELPGSLPFKLEPYRILVALISAGWIASLLVDRRVQLRRTIIDGPLFAYLVIAGASVVANASKLHDSRVSSSVWKSLTFLISFVLVFYLIVSVVRRFRDLDFLVRLLVGGGAVVAFLRCDRGPVPLQRVQPPRPHHSRASPCRLTR